MPNPGKFHGKRKAFLTSKREMFAAGVENNQMGDVLLQILRGYFKRFPVDWPETREPSDEELAAVDDNEADQDVDIALDDLSGEEYDAEVERRRARTSLIEAKKGQIKRWFVYRYMHDNNFNPRTMDSSNPFNTVLLKLSGLNPGQRPRLKTAANLWCKEPEVSTLIQQEFDKVANSIEPNRRAAHRASIVSRLFKDLPAEEKQEWMDVAKAEHEEALAVYEELCKGQVSTKPEDRQRCISGLVRFMQPILDRAAEATGFKFACIAGGPEPAAGGRINVISIYSGTTVGPVEMNFGQAERAAYKDIILPIFGQFMKSCFTPEDCRSRALVTPDSQNSLQSMALEILGTSFDSLGIPGRSSPPAMSTTSSDNQAQPGAPVPSTTATSIVPAPPPPTPTVEPPHPSTFGLATSVPATLAITPATAAASPGTSGASSGSNNGAAEQRDGIDDMLADVDRSLATIIVGSPTSSAGSVLVTPAGSRSTSPSPEAVEGSEVDPARATLKRPAPTSQHGSTSPSSKRLCPGPLDNSILPSGAPEWMQKAVEMLGTNSFGQSWQELVATWIVYEGKKEFQGDGRLSPKNRPKIIAEWIKNARKAEWRPKSLMLPDRMGAAHNEWWTSLQPAWRRREDGSLEVVDSGDGWEGLNVCGVNGLLSALASLFFWAVALDDPAADTQWESSVRDLLWVVQQLLTSE